MGNRSLSKIKSGSDLATRKSGPIPRRIVLGVTGSIAAYKSPEIVRHLVKAGFEVRCLMTQNAARFTTSLTLATLSSAPVFENPDDPELWKMAHLSLSDWASIFLIAPATADFIARLASGLADNLLNSLALAFEGKIVVCPAMDGGMWNHPATQANVRRIKEFGYEVWGPEVGELASGNIGMGRMLEPQEIVQRLESFPLSPKTLAAKNVR